MDFISLSEKRSFKRHKSDKTNNKNAMKRIPNNINVI